MYVLDTDICSYLMKRAHPELIERVKVFAPRDLKVSVVTLFELEYGIQRSDRRDLLRRVVRAFLENVELLPWTEPRRARPALSGLYLFTALPPLTAAGGPVDSEGYARAGTCSPSRGVV